MEKVFIITGVCGHFGNTLARALIERGYAVRGLALPAEDASMLPPEVRLTRGDVRDRGSMEALFDGLPGDGGAAGVETVFIHAAGIISIGRRNARLLYDVNVGGTANVIALCRERAVDRLVYISSVHAIPERPTRGVIAEITRFLPDLVRDGYSRSKALASQLVLDAARDGLDALIVHPSGMIGPNDYGRGYMTETIADYLNGTLYAGISGGYDFVDVRDVVTGTIAAAERGRSGECYILSNRYYPVREIADALREMSGRPAVRVIFPVWFIRMFLPLAWAYFRAKKGKSLITADSLHILTAPSAFSHAKASAELGYQPRELRDTLRDTIEFLRRIGAVALPQAARAAGVRAKA